MNGQKYLNLTKEKLQLRMSVNHCIIIMQGGTLCQRSKIATDFSRASEITLLK